MSSVEEQLKDFDNKFQKLEAGQVPIAEVVTYTYDWQKDSFYYAATRLREKRAAGLIPKRHFR